MNNRIYLNFAAACCLLCACAKSESASTSTALLSPTSVAVKQLDESNFNVSWRDNSDSEIGYEVYLIEPDDIDNLQLKATLEANVTSYTLTETLIADHSYYIGVRAIAKNSKYNSRLIKTLFKTQAPDDPDAPKVTLLKAQSHDVCIKVEYNLSNIAKDAEVGVCWSESENPTIADAHQIGAPLADSDKSERIQVISNVLLEYEHTYYFRAYAKVGSEIYYSESSQCELGRELEAITFDWKQESFSSLPSSVKVYSYDGLLNGRKCRAWYASADLSAGDVEFKVNIPDSPATIDDQASSSGNCLVIVNGGYFYNKSNTGLGCVNGVISGGVNAVRGSLKTGDEEYNVMYNVTRGVFGVDASGVPAVYWTGVDAGGKSLFFDRPLPTVKGEAKYPAVTTTLPTSNVVWSPLYAQSAGPLLLMNGKCPFDFENTSKGEDYYLTNYEVMPYDIFGPDVKPDRTAAGYTKDGKVILFIVDGRIETSDGATLVELAQIMKGLGCVGAVNFDGGGSTGMVAGGSHLNDLTGGNRPVMSTLGIYKK